MGAPKGLIPFKGQPWLTWQIKQFFEAGGTCVLVVLGVHKEDYRRALPWLGDAEKQWMNWDAGKVAFVVNPTPDFGQFSSIHTGLRFLCDADVPGCLLQPIDVPIPNKLIINDLMKAKSDSFDAIVPVYQEKGGHPAVLSRHFMDILLTLPVDDEESRLDRQIGLLPSDRLIKIPVKDYSVCLNLNASAEFQEYAHAKPG